MRLLIIEDDPAVSTMLNDYFTGRHYRVDTAGNYGEVITHLSAMDYDCIVMEPLVPECNGPDLLGLLRSAGKTPAVVMISSRDITNTCLEGFGLGADDYLAKPVDPDELLTRIGNIIRRRRHATGTDNRFGNVRLLEQRQSAAVGDTEINLNRKEFGILKYLLARPLQIVPKDSLTRNVWNNNIPDNGNYDFVYVQVHNLREKLENAGANISVVSVYGTGYKIIKKGPGR